MSLINDINHIPNSGRLYIVWQESKEGGQSLSGRRFVVGEIIYNSEYEQINYFEGKKDLVEAAAEGFRKLNAFAGKEGQKLLDQEISKALSKRIVARDRSDFDDYLKSFMISPSVKDKIDTLTLLANTGRGRNFGDGYSFYPDVASAKAPFQITFEVAGHRHSQGVLKYIDKTGLLDQSVALVAQPSSEHDNYAIQVLLDGVDIGYVPKGLSKGLYDFTRQNRITGFIARVNGTKERPSLIVLATVS